MNELLYRKTMQCILYWLRQQGFRDVDRVINRSIGSNSLGLDNDMDYVLRYEWFTICKGNAEYNVPMFKFPAVHDHYNGNQLSFWIKNHMEVVLG